MVIRTSHSASYPPMVYKGDVLAAIDATEEDFEGSVSSIVVYRCSSLQCYASMFVYSLEGLIAWEIETSSIRTKYIHICI